ncbi:hypothetical protein PAHAL_3G432300 [Panicum hallii]|uniref:Uncharacterized protein n=1 Tax=Panicum hallii TaxID=206008 RepID=A0A2S3HE22_9POAL|nr:hypothetical protein PAHAL_3G432300 [Panicum hallii]
MPLRDLTTETLSSMLQLLQFTRHRQQKAHGNRRKKDRCISSPTTSGSPPGVTSFPLSLHKSLHALLFYCPLAGTGQSLAREQKLTPFT